ncbi:hypothetical protein P12x_002992 [Tundrisphaera lichenicola]|uniref:hypothetical protein n=1 Tax=Tundrisphaera lichenicola TaxID=2029860 RepID=UPI003EBE7530
MRKVLIDYVPGLIGGIIGGGVGYLIFSWLVGYGLWAPVIPGALTGLGCGMLSRTDSNLRGILCAIEALVIGVVAEWRLFSPPFETDGSLVDYLKQIHHLPPPTLFMLGLGVFLGFWWGRECTLRGRLVPPASKPRSIED